MAYDRAQTGPWAWIKTVGAANNRLTNDWLNTAGFLLQSVWFPKHPRSIKQGDFLVYYAAGEGVFPAVVEVVSDEVTRDSGQSRDAQRWPWRMDVTPRAALPHLSDSPTLEQVGLNPLRLRRQSHILLTNEEWESARAAFLPPIGA